MPPEPGSNRPFSPFLLVSSLFFLLYSSLPVFSQATSANSSGPILKKAAASLRKPHRPKSKARSPQALQRRWREAYREGDQQRERGYDSPSEAAHYYLQKRLPTNERSLPVEKYLDASQKMQRMQRHSSVASTRLAVSTRAAGEVSGILQPGLQTWSPLGPGNIGGRTRALVIDSNDANIMYAGGCSRGGCGSPSMLAVAGRLSLIS
ncbi:MAG: hypothetical protein JWO13_3069 [Acidobacteriales bacterium]|nr:hypothetical protein [Terriglobales bacterium]